MAETEGKSDSKTSSDTAASDGGKADTPSNYSRGENQKAVTEAYRRNWADVFGKKKKKRKGRT